MSHTLHKHPSLLHAQEIAEICSPLRKLNITYFGHVKIDAGKKFAALGNNPLFTEHYLKNKYYMTDIHMVDEKKFGKFFVWDGIQFTGQSAQMCHEAAEYFDIHNPFTIIQRNSNGSIDYYHFANNSSRKQINQAYLANLDLLNLFILYYKEQIRQSKALMKAYDFTIDVKHAPTVEFEDSSLTYDRSQFMQQIDNNMRLEIGGVMLSKRQSQLLQFFMAGKTIKEIAKILNLSPRTVGHYFETVKHKLDVTTRSELFTKAKKIIID